MIFGRVKCRTAIGLLLALSGCEKKPDPLYFVTVGDPFFDDSARRLTPEEKSKMGVHQPNDLQGFVFTGENETCIVLMPRKRNIVLHGTNAGSCYDRKTNAFTRHI